MEQTTSRTIANISDHVNENEFGIKMEMMVEDNNNQLEDQLPNVECNFEEPIVIHNIVATANFGCSLDLARIAVRVRNAEYNPKRFRAVIMRIFEPRTTAMIFASGKIVCTGAKSERLACIAVRKFCKIIQKLGNDAKFAEFKVQNIVATVDVKFPIRLDMLAVKHTQFCSYDPDFFPALIYRMIMPRTVLLIFVSGKIIITGAKTRKDIIQTMNNMRPVLFKFRK